MPRRETRHSIQRALDAAHRARAALWPDLPAEVAEKAAREMARQRARLGAEESVEVHARVVGGRHKIEVRTKRRRRRPGEGSVPAPVEPPRGPKPLSGGAAAPLEFD